MTLYMPLFRSCTTLRTLIQLHAHLLVTGLHKTPPASTRLIESYAEFATLHSSRLVFQTFQKPDSFMWAVLIKCHVWNNFFEDAISLYYNMINQQAQLTEFIYPSVLRACSGFGDLGIGRNVHSRIIKSGFDDDDVIQTTLLSMYGEIGCLGDAWKVFDTMTVRDVVSWSSIIASCFDNGEVVEGLKMFRLMVTEGVNPDFVTMLSLAEACGELSFRRLGRLVHGHILRREIKISGPLGNSLITMYSKCGDLLSAERIFVEIKKSCTASWTALISCYNRSGCFRKALDAFIKMLEFKVEPNSTTLMSILGSCAGLALLREGKSVHCHIIRKLTEAEGEFLGPALIELYAKCGKLSESMKVLHSIGERNIVSWNMLISEYACKGMSEEALVVFVQMQAQGHMPDSYSLASSLSACGNVDLLQLGLQIHGHVIKRDFSNEFVLNSLIDMYSKCGFLSLAYRIFERIQQKSVVTWNAMICGFSHNGKSDEPFNLFNQMYLNCLEINEVTFLIVIQACSNLGNLGKGKWVHHKLITYGVSKDMYIDTALADIHSGSVEEGEFYFNEMRHFGVEPNSDHYACMVDLLSRAGDINRAYKMIHSMPFPANASIYSALLNGCRIHKRFDTMKIIEKDLLDISTEDTGYYSLLSNIYAQVGNWDKFREVRYEMENAGLWKVPGYSTIELENKDC
ncbi:hypothetical protein QYF36_016317 [Acer negundo]|nr:hypothetical protein QYF36_016317 [Acer negundo]